jgi:hypothetical protein
MFPLWRSKRCVIVKYWFRKLKDVLLCTTVRRKNTVIRGWKRDCGDQCARAKIEMLGIMRKAKNMVFQPKYAHCFTATTSLPQTYYLQYQNTSTMSNIPNKRTVNSPAVSDALSNQSSDFLHINEEWIFWIFYLFQIKQWIKCVSKIRQVFFYLNGTANVSSGGTQFLVLLSWNVRLGPSKTSSLSNVAPDILKYKKKKLLWMCLQVFVQGVEFSFM